MKEFKFNANLCSGHISPADNNYAAYMEARKKIQNMQGLHVRECPYVEVIIRVPDPRQDWIDKWYKRAVAAADDTVIFKFVKDGIICIPLGLPEHAEVAAPRKGDKYDRKTGIAVAFAKTRNEKIPEYI